MDLNVYIDSTRKPFEEKRLDKNENSPENP